MREKIAFISLGCPKNQVDAELMLAKLSAAGYELPDSPLGADLVIVNTCGFIASAKQESIDTILEMAQLKEDGEIKKILVIGCMAERYRDEILKEIPEADAVAGIGADADIVALVRGVLDGSVTSLYPPKTDLPLEGERALTTPPHWAYLKLADGCSNCCSYCAIPLIRGPFRSRPMESVLREAEALVGGGARELILIAQDTTRYGEDLAGRSLLPDLLRALCGIENLKWIRLLYCYPDRITDELLTVMREEKKVLHYLDLPLQHADGRILAAMNRRGDRASLTSLIGRIRDALPDAVLRTTFITGFPGEEEEAFTELGEFIEEIGFDRLGCFPYSAEEGTPACDLPGRVDEETAERRAELLMERQFEIMSDKQRDLIGEIRECVIEDYDGYTDSYTGRTWMDAPEIDTVIHIISSRPLDVGDFVDVEITDLNEYDLIGEAL